jgi:hypothetical protein
MTRRITAAEVIATHISYDLAEMSEYRYQPTRYSSPAIYAVGDQYYSAPMNDKLHAGFKWRLDGTILGRRVYSAGTEIVD